MNDRHVRCVHSSDQTQIETQNVKGADANMDV